MTQQLSKERLGEIAVLTLKHKLLRDGAQLSPKGLKTEVMSGAKDLGITTVESALFMKEAVQILCAECNKMLDEIIAKNS